MINPLRLGVAAGIVWGVSIFLITLFALYNGYGTQFLTGVSSIYPGFAVTGVGSIVGLIYGFVDGFIGFYLIGWIYNKLTI